MKEIEIKTCTKKNCHYCEKPQVINEGHDFKLLDTSELCVETNACPNF